jgi:ribosome-associated protein
MLPRHDLDLVHRWCAVAAKAASDKKATDLVVYDVGEILAITDAFLIVSASNDRQVRTVVEEIERALKEAGGPSPLQIEGAREAQWVLMDYGDFVVHVFRHDIRAFYDLDRLWSDAPRHVLDEPPLAVAGPPR